MPTDHLIDAMIAGCRAYTPDGIFIEPTKVPRDKDHSKRSKKELKLWWGRYYVVKNSAHGFNAYCFDGGAWDRATWIANGETVEAAVDLIRAHAAQFEVAA